MTEDQIVLLRDKVEVWTRQAERGPPDFRDYNQRAADALASLLRRANELEGEVSTLRLQQQTDRQTIARLASSPAESSASGTDGQAAPDAPVCQCMSPDCLLNAARAEGGAGRCGTCHHFTPERDGFGSCARWAQGYGSQDLAPNEVCVENDEGWGMIMGADFGCVLYLPAESDASSPAEGRAGTLPPDEHIPPPNPVSHEGEA